MRERAELALKVLCGVLVAVLLYQTGRALMRGHPFAQVTIPALPTLTVDTNAAPAGGPVATGPGMPGPRSAATNLLAGTNSSPTNLLAKLSATNFLAMTNQETNLPATLADVKTVTNAVAPTNVLASSNALAQTRGLAATNAGTTGTNIATGTNALAGTNEMAGTTHRKKSHSPHSPMMGMGFFPGMGGPGKPLPELPAVEKARIDAVVSSELLGPVPHPMPKALLGIAGQTAFLRSDSGETGLVKVGDSVGDLKLLRIGINRVLIEQNGQKQELTIFDGMGSDSLLTTSDKNSNETNHH